MKHPAHTVSIELTVNEINNMIKEKYGDRVTLTRIRIGRQKEPIEMDIYPGDVGLFWFKGMHFLTWRERIWSRIKRLKK